MLSYVGVDVVIVKIVYSLAFGHGQGGQESSRSKGFIGLPTIEQKIEFQEEAQEEGAHKRKRLGALKEKKANK